MIEDQIILHQVHTHVHVALHLKCILFQLCFIKEESEFGDKVYSSGCMPFQVFKFFIHVYFALLYFLNFNCISFQTAMH